MGACVQRETGFEIESDYEEEEIDQMNGRIVNY